MQPPARRARCAQTPAACRAHATAASRCGRPWTGCCAGTVGIVGPAVLLLVEDPVRQPGPVPRPPPPACRQPRSMIDFEDAGEDAQAGGGVVLSAWTRGRIERPRTCRSARSADAVRSARSPPATGAAPRSRPSAASTDSALPSRCRRLDCSMALRLLACRRLQPDRRFGGLDLGPRGRAQVDPHRLMQAARGFGGGGIGGQHGNSAMMSVIGNVRARRSRRSLGLGHLVTQEPPTQRMASHQALCSTAPADRTDRAPRAAPRTSAVPPAPWIPAPASARRRHADVVRPVGDHVGIRIAIQERTDRPRALAWPTWRTSTQAGTERSFGAHGARPKDRPVAASS